jgi:hypothetical protein
MEPIYGLKGWDSPEKVGMSYITVIPELKDPPILFATLEISGGTPVQSYP